MRMKHVYLLFCVVGTVAPYAFLVPWLREHGLDIGALATELFSTRIGAFFGVDVLVSAIVLLIFISAEGRRNRIRCLWAPVIGVLLVGVSLGLPLFLFLREAAWEQTRVES